MCLILTVTDIGLFESPDLTVTFIWGGGGWVRGEVYKIKVDTRDELLGGILDATAVHIKKCADQLRQKTHDLCTGALRLVVGFSNIYRKL